jgi:hypothetical protein
MSAPAIPPPVTVPTCGAVGCFSLPTVLPAARRSHSNMHWCQSSSAPVVVQAAPAPAPVIKKWCTGRVRSAPATQVARCDDHNVVAPPRRLTAGEPSAHRRRSRQLPRRRRRHMIGGLV